MTVCHVYWLFDSMVAHIRLTNPFGSGEKSGEDTPSGPVSREVQTLDSGVSFAQAVHNSGLNRGATGITKYDNIGQVRTKDPLLADFLTEFKED